MTAGSGQGLAPSTASTRAPRVRAYIEGVSAHSGHRRELIGPCIQIHLGRNGPCRRATVKDESGPFGTCVHAEASGAAPLHVASTSANSLRTVAPGRIRARVARRSSPSSPHGAAPALHGPTAVPRSPPVRADAGPVARAQDEAKLLRADLLEGGATDRTACSSPEEADPHGGGSPMTSRERAGGAARRSRRPAPRSSRLRSCRNGCSSPPRAGAIDLRGILRFLGPGGGTPTTWGQAASATRLR